MQDYELYRPQLPKSFYTNIYDLNIGLTGQRVLDISTGYGNVACELAKRKCHVTGIDTNEENIKMAKIIAKWDMLDIDYLNCPLDKIPFQDNSFDVVLLPKECTCKVKEDDYKEIKRVLVKGGKLIISNLSLKASEEPVMSNFQIEGLIKEMQFRYNEDLEYSPTHWMKIRKDISEVNEYEMKFKNDKIIIPHIIETNVFESN
jgi:ubiquinone/menaquinone biosynthesis C-methylase UbiE